MCDYSLCGLPTRLAVEGEELVVHRFQSGSMGLTSPQSLIEECRSVTREANLWKLFLSIFREPADPPSAIAVCIPPGAQLILKGIPEDLQRRWHVGSEERVFFIQTSAETNSYRDAVRFRNKFEALLQYLREGMKVIVLSLGNDSTGGEDEFAMIGSRGVARAGAVHGWRGW